MTSLEARGTADPIERLILELGRLPGVGQRSATRLAFHLIRGAYTARERGETALAQDLAQALLEASARINLCRDCQNLSVAERCGLCTDSRRDPSLLCVVEGVQDLRAIESTSTFRGLYHVLHGALAPLDGIGPEELKLGLLLARLTQQQIAEVILATNTDVEGDATALYLAKLIRPLGVRVTRLASGVPMGGELEFLDQATLGRALAERREF